MTRKYAIAVARCRRKLKKYEERIDRTMLRFALSVEGETYPLAERVIGLVKKKQQIADIAATDRHMSAGLTVQENEALTVCTNGEGSKRAAVRLGISRGEILSRARRALDKCCAALKSIDFSCEDYIFSFLTEMEKSVTTSSVCNKKVQNYIT